MKKQRTKKSIKYLMSGLIRLKTFWTLSIFLTIFLIGILILQIQSLAQKSELISLSQRRLTELSEENNERVLLFSSIERTELSQLAQDLNFERIGQIRYIRAIEGTVLAR